VRVRHLEHDGEWQADAEPGSDADDAFHYNEAQGAAEGHHHHTTTRDKSCDEVDVAESADSDTHHNHDNDAALSALLNRDQGAAYDAARERTGRQVLQRLLAEVEEQG
jgi:hypothetical protein